jgi:hypothetical protein
LAKALNEALTGRKKGPLFFTYTVELADVSGEAEGTREPGELLLYPAMLEKKIAASADLLIVLPLAFEADPHAKEPVALTIDPGGGNGDLFGRAGPEDNGFFDQIGSLGFSLAVKNMAGLRAGTLFLQNKTDVKKLRYRLPVVNFDPAGPPGSFSLGSEDIEQIKAIWPFVLQASLEFKAGDIVRIERNFNIELQGLTIKAGGEYAFETGL